MILIGFGLAELRWLGLSLAELDCVEKDGGHFVAPTQGLFYQGLHGDQVTSCAHIVDE